MARIVIKPIIPKPLRLARVADAIERAIEDQLAKKIQRDFESTVSTWVERQEKDKPLGGIPKFSIRRLDVGRFEISTEHPVYYYVNFGTAAHPITPRNTRMLRFRESYRAKTTPRQIGSTGGGKYGRYQFRRRVMHKGSRARDFDTAIADANVRYAETVVSEAIDREARALGS